MAVYPLTYFYFTFVLFLSFYFHVFSWVTNAHVASIFFAARCSYWGSQHELHGCGDDLFRWYSMGINPSLHWACCHRHLHGLTSLGLVLHMCVQTGCEVQ